MEIDTNNQNFKDGFAIGNHIAFCPRCGKMYEEMLHKTVTGCPEFIKFIQALPREGGE